MMKLKLTKREYVIAAVLVFAAVYFVAGMIVTTAVAGLAGGAVVGANLPASWRARLYVGSIGRKKAPKTVEGTVKPVETKDAYGGGS